MIGFPNSNLSFEKILMFYNIRCKNGNVSPAVSGQTDIGCGEWDASCNTYITDSSQVDSNLQFTKSHWISNFVGTSFPYTSSAMYNFYRNIQKNIVVDSILSESKDTIGYGVASIQSPFVNQSLRAKTQILYTQSELLAAGLVAGNIDGILLQAIAGNTNANYLRIRIKHSNQSQLSDSLPDIGGFSEVYFKNTNLSAGLNRFQFYTPFVWDGISNILIEFTYSNTQLFSNLQFVGHSTTLPMSLLSHDDNAFLFNGANYVEALNYKGIPGSNARTVEAWIKTSTADKEIVSWGTDLSSAKWVFRINNVGALRVEVNGGYTYGTTVLTDGQWHHVACVLNGSSVSNIQLYVDGVLETGLTTSNLAVATDTIQGVNVRISRGLNNRYFNGNIDEVRMWNAALSGQTIRKWMFSSLQSNHLNANALQLYYPFDENAGDTVYDHSGHQRHAVAVNVNFWSELKGVNLFKSFELALERPNTVFLQGNYNLTLTNDTLFDSIPQSVFQVKEYQILSHAGTSISDQVVTTMDTLVWKAGYDNFYDEPTGLLLDSSLRTADGTFQMVDLSYFSRRAMKYEIMSFVTPYGINLNMGPNGKTWTFDLTDFAPILRGNKRITVERGGQWMEDMDIKFAFIVGTPSRNVLAINQIWPVNSKSYTDIMADKTYETRQLKLHNGGIAYKIRSSITGHGQEGEFIPRNHFINVNGGAAEYNWQVWKDCAENPLYPQGGTWIYSRAGWCPGAPTNLRENDITPFINPAQNNTIDYGIITASGSSNYIVNNQLVIYGDTNFNLDLAVVDLSAPTDKVEYARFNSICKDPSIVIQNNGKTPITSANIHYWVNNSAQVHSFQWTGSLGFLQKATINLPVDSALWSDLQQGINQFHVQLMNANGSNDDYTYNNFYHSTFTIPDVVPSNFVIFLSTNVAASETSYKIYDENNNIIFHKNGLSNSKVYRDTFLLAQGCYRLEVLDSDGDGLKFFANSDGSGSLSLRRLTGPVIKSFNPDFGSRITYNFTVDYPLSYEDLFPSNQTAVFPNPTKGKCTIQHEGETAKKLQIFDAMGKLILQKEMGINSIKKYEIDLSNYPKGLYIMQLYYKNRSEQHKIILQ
jgi:hypothetical protein